MDGVLVRGKAVPRGWLCSSLLLQWFRQRWVSNRLGTHVSTAAQHILVGEGSLGPADASNVGAEAACDSQLWVVCE